MRPSSNRPPHAGYDLQSRHHRLLARIHRKYQTITESLDLDGLQLAFTRVADPDKVLDQVAAEVDRRERQSGERQQDPLHLPYWAELWDSAAGIGKLLVTMGRRSDAGPATAQHPTPPHPDSPKGFPRRVLDLGCGMGLTGTVAAALGAQVLFADLEAPALLFARLNSLPFADRVRTRRLNWQIDRLQEQFDLIIGADILYERKQWEFLEPFWRAHLREGASVLLGEPGRQTGDAFGEWIVSREWHVNVLEQAVVTRPKPIRIFQIRSERGAG